MAVSCLLLLFQLVHPHAGSGLNMEVVQVITDELRKRMGLTLFGYDTVVQENTGVLASQHLCIVMLILCKHIVNKVEMTNSEAQQHGIMCECGLRITPVSIWISFC